ncbi:MAG: hypothetical protein ACREL7_10625 [Longimicrobiales bacterium]
MRMRFTLPVAAGALFFLYSCQQPDTQANSLDGMVSEDSLGDLEREMAGRTQTYERILEEKDTLIATLQTAMVLLGELSTIEREIASGEPAAQEPALEPWDQRVRRQLQSLRSRYADMAGDLSRSESRLRELERSGNATRSALAEALEATARLRADNERKQSLIDQLSERVATLTREKAYVVAQSSARADTIRTLTRVSNTVYWTFGSRDELEALGLIETVGGRQIVFTRVGETLAAARDADLEHFKSIDRRFASVIDLPDDAEYEIVTRQDPAFVEPTSIRRDGDRWFVRDSLRISDVRFWEGSPYLILVRH